MRAIEESNGQLGIFQSTRALTYIAEKKNFYLKALENHSQNALGSYIQNYNVSFYTELLKHRLGVENLSMELVFAVKYQSYGSVGLLIEWLNGELPLSPEEFAEVQIQNKPGILRRILFGQESC